MRKLKPGLALLAAALTLPAAAQYTTPHLAEPAATQGSAQAPVSYRNLGLVGSGHLAANTLDFNGDTLGSFSSFGILPGSWRRHGNTYQGQLLTLPDRGRNDPAKGLFYDYPARLERLQLSFTPATPQISPGASRPSPQVTLTPKGGLWLRDFHGQPFTGADPGDGIQVQRGIPLPSPRQGVGKGKISLDAEALQLQADGSFYIGDEYSANIFYFSAAGQLLGIIPAPPAVAPRRNGRLYFGSLQPPDSGRRNNQGLEGLSITPNGHYLFAALQSALVQDATPGKASGRAYTRLLVYDMRRQPTPERPVAEYLVSLPTYTAKGNGQPVDEVAAQSEIIALDQHRLLMLARDSNGLGGSIVAPIVYKSILLVDTQGASNLLGSRYDQPGESVLRGPNDPHLKQGLIPAQASELINLLDPAALARFGLSLAPDSGQPSRQLSAKWEALDLLPALDPSAPSDYFLLVGNDNDFIARHCRMQAQSCDSGFDNDNRLLVYRLRLPGLARLPIQQAPTQQAPLPNPATSP